MTDVDYLGYLLTKQEKKRKARAKAKRRGEIQELIDGHFIADHVIYPNDDRCCGYSHFKKSERTMVIKAVMFGASMGKQGAIEWCDSHIDFYESEAE